MELEMNVAGIDAPAKQAGVLRVLAGALIKPRATTAALRQTRWTWWAIPAFLILAVTVLTVVAYSYAHCGYIYQLEMDHYARSASQGGRSPNPITPLPITMAIRVAGRVLSTGGAWLVWSGALYLALILLGYNGVAFGSVWTLVLWAWMPYAVRDVLQSIYMTVAHRPVYNQGLSGLVVDRTPPPLASFDYVIPTTNQEALASFLARLDVYLIWQLALMVIGAMALTRVSRRKAVAVILGIWLVFALVALIPQFFPATFARFRYF
ncbi:MAG: YIP1 family protein [Anaerolineae bacterium]